MLLRTARTVAHFICCIAAVLACVVSGVPAVADDRAAFQQPRVVVPEGWWLHGDCIVLQSVWAFGSARLAMERQTRARVRFWVYALDPAWTGVHRGTQLFAGTIEREQVLKGTWFDIAGACGTLPIAATGRLVEDGEAIVFEGEAPSIEPGCTLGPIRPWSRKLRLMGRKPFLPDTPVEMIHDPFPGIVPYGLAVKRRSKRPIRVFAEPELIHEVGTFAARKGGWGGMTIARPVNCDDDVDWDTVLGEKQINETLARCNLHIVAGRHDGYVRGSDVEMIRE